jgi:adenosylhomocysteine nucleosidase
MSRIAIVAALEHEIRPLVRDWTVHERQYSGRSFRFFENGEVVLVCGGIGAEAARRAAQAVIALYSPALVYSAGFAGAATDAMKVGEILIPRRVVNAGDGSAVDTGAGQGVLVTFTAIASPGQKARLAAAFGAHAIDMEASAVAQAAEARGVAFAAVKAISEASEFVFPPMEKFIDSTGQLHTGQFAASLILRPWRWRSAIRLARNSARASRALSSWLQHKIKSGSNELASGQQPSPLEASTGR